MNKTIGILLMLVLAAVLIPVAIVVVPAYFFVWAAAQVLKGM